MQVRGKTRHEQRQKKSTQDSPRVEHGKARRADSRNNASRTMKNSVRQLLTVHGMPRRAWLLRAKLSRRRTVQLPIPKEKENQ